VSTDLSAFRRHGGKLIIWQGWADQAIPTFGTVDYYQTLVSRMGGLTATQQFARMFLFPTVAHCGGGYANSSFDLVYPMVQWVEGGTAPSEVTATDTIASKSLQRPVYPYPLVPKYDGNGADPSLVTSFRGVSWNERSPRAWLRTRWCCSSSRAPAGHRRRCGGCCRRGCR
jgi:Tannase and feruloyl esterase